MKNLRQAKKVLGVKAPGSSDDVVSQQRLIRFEQAEDELRVLKKKFDELRAGMKDVLKSGASVSTGRRGVESGIRFRRHPRYKQALIDAKGEDYQRKILDQTEYRPYYYVRLITRNGKQ